MATTNETYLMLTALEDVLYLKDKDEALSKAQGIVGRSIDYLGGKHTPCASLSKSVSEPNNSALEKPAKRKYTRRNPVK
ncbi:hypothetical protein FACS1894120_0710 [Clostridia bacterium]|nr:hypothetical protein FACS1894120_0710 [Clostridia bacterium]